VAQHVALRRPDLVRKLVVAGSAPGGVPGAAPLSDKVLGVMTKQEADENDLLFLFYREPSQPQDTTPRRGASGVRNRCHAPTRGDREDHGGAFEQVRSNLEAIKQPVLHANGIHDVMISAVASYVAVEHLDSAILLLYSDAGHGFPREMLLTGRSRFCACSKWVH
jgi:pimeloyl-ACP methyl ester carboxylesterase